MIKNTKKQNILIKHKNIPKIHPKKISIKYSQKHNKKYKKLVTDENIKTKHLCFIK